MAEGSGGGSGKSFVVFGLAIPLVVLSPVLVILLLVPLLLSSFQSSQSSACTTGTGSWVAWAKGIADDDSHGYSQPNRQGNPDYDCSSLVFYALKNAGLDVGSSAFSTLTMDAVLSGAGFERHDWSSVADLQAGDIVWSVSHTEIYMGDGKFVGAHHDENGGITGSTPGDQTGDEISVDSYAAGYTAFYRYANGDGGQDGGGQAVSGETSGGVEGLTSSQAKAEWFSGRAGPDDACATYPEGQCTWGACVRAYKLGWQHVGPYWGNGGDWAASAAAEGYETTGTAPVAGAIISFPAGVQGADSTYGHVGVVEAVDASAGTVRISEMNAKGPVYSGRTLKIDNGATYILPKDSISGADSSSAQCVASGDEDGLDGTNASAETARKIARRKLRDYGWDDSQYDCLVNLWEGESSWDLHAENPSSGAYGIPQALPASKMASAGQDWRDNASTQIAWGLGYIRDRYGSPCGAWETWQSRSPHWY